MATMAKWGPKTWGVDSSKIVALEGMTFSYTQIADENTSTEDKNTTNERGTELFPLSFTTKLVAGTGVDVWQEIQSWQALVTKAHYFYLNGKKLHPKLLQLRQVNVSDIKLDNIGRMRMAKISFTFKEYDEDTTSVKTDTSALNVTPSADTKKAKKTENIQVTKAESTGVQIGSYVKLTGSKYFTGEKIPDYVKQMNHVVSKISGEKVLIGAANGINSWVKKSEITLV